MPVSTTPKPDSNGDPVGQATQACRAVLQALPAELPPTLKLDALLSSYLSMAQHLGSLPQAGAALCAIGPVLRRGGGLAEAEAAVNAPHRRVLALVTAVRQPPGAQLPPDHEASRDRVASMAVSLSNALPTSSSDADVICAALTFLCAVASTSEQNAVMASSLMRAASDQLLIGPMFDLPDTAGPVPPTSSVH